MRVLRPLPVPTTSLTIRICHGVQYFASSSRWLATATRAHRARDIVTLSRIRL